MTGVGTFFAGEVSVASTYLFDSSLYSYFRGPRYLSLSLRYSSSGMIRVLPEALEEAEADALSEELGEENRWASQWGKPTRRQADGHPWRIRPGQERQGQYRPEGYCVGWVLD